MKMKKIQISVKDLVMPYFVVGGKNKKKPVKNMPGVARLSVDNLLREAVEIRRQGIDKVLLFGVCLPRQKDAQGSYAYAKHNLITKAVVGLKKEIKDIVVFTDVCLCAYTSHGHCGIVRRVKGENGKWNIDNPATLKILSQVALVYAETGADWVAPSAMAKRQVWAIRQALNKYGFQKVRILGYSAKFASNFYGPFREAMNSAPQFGDRSSYQLDFRNGQTALKEIAADIKEGADMVMVKPALSYLDVIQAASQQFRHPLAAYNTSGEYAMVKFGAKLGLWEERKMVLEIITSIKRAGADFIISYHAKDIAKWLKAGW